MTNSSNAAIRCDLRKKRVNLSENEYRSAGLALCRQIINSLPLKNSKKNIGLYYPIQGEVDTRPLISQLTEFGHDIYLPRIHPFCKEELLFLRYQDESLLMKNNWKIPEPILDLRLVIPFSELDILFVPLVGFDPNNNRIGMGGGFYDRMLQDYSKFHLLPIGLGYEFQRIEKFTVHPWDIPLPIIITPDHAYYK